MRPEELLYKESPMLILLFKEHQYGDSECKHLAVSEDPTSIVSYAERHKTDRRRAHDLQTELQYIISDYVKAQPFEIPEPVYDKILTLPNTTEERAERTKAKGLWKAKHNAWVLEAGKHYDTIVALAIEELRKKHPELPSDFRHNPSHTISYDEGKYEIEEIELL